MSGSNGHALTLRTVRDGILAEFLTHVHESWDHNDDYSWDDWLRGRDRVPQGRSADPPSKPSDRWYGRDWPRIRNIIDLDIYRSASRMICAENAYAVGAVQNTLDAVLGSGGKFKSEDKDVEKYLNDWSLCYWSGGGDPWANAPLKESAERMTLRRLVRDGEAIFHATEDEVKLIDPERLRSHQDGREGWSYGIRHQTTPYTDVNRVEEYSFVMEGGEEFFAPAADVVHVLIDGTDSTVKRGRPLFSYDVLQGFIDAARTVSAAAVGATIRAKIALLWQIPWGDAADVEGMTFSKSCSTPRDRRDPDSKLPDGSEIFTPEGMLPAPLPADYTPQQLEAVQASLRMVGSALAHPEYMISGDSSNANFASTRESGTPFVRRSQGLQQRVKSVALRLGRYSLQYAVRVGIFTEEKVRSARYNYDLPDVVVTDFDAKLTGVVAAVQERILTPEEARVSLGYTAKPERIS